MRMSSMPRPDCMDMTAPMLPPSLVNTGFTPKAYSMEAAMALTAGLSRETISALLPTIFVTFAATPAGTIDATCFSKSLATSVRVLVRHQAHADLAAPAAAGMIVLGALALESSPYAVDVQRRPGPGALKHRVSLFGHQLRHAQHGRLRFLVEREPGHLLTLHGSTSLARS